MRTNKSKNLLTTIDALRSSKFYTVNGHGIIGFKSGVSFVASHNATCFMNDEISSKEAIQLVKDLNQAIEPVLEKYLLLAQHQLSETVTKLTEQMNP